MKKLFYLLLLVYSGIFAQVSSGMEQEFDYGIKNNSSQQILTPDTLVTKGADGTYGHTSAYRLPVSNDTYDALQTKVPYTGATSNVNLGENGLTTGYLGLDLTPTNTPTAVGTFYWDTANKTASLIDGSGNTVLQIGQEERILIHNGTGSALTDGQVVYVTGSTGLLPSVALANASSEVTSSKTIGVVTESIANGASGFITTTGLINGLNTSAYNEGDILWLGTTAGTYTTTAPTSPNHRVLIGYVIKKAGGNGSILVKIQNTQELSESSDVLLGTLSNNDILIYESSTGLWKNKQLSTLLGGTGSQFVKGNGSLDSTIYATQSALNTEVTNRTNADATLTTNLNSEIARATAAELILTNNLANKQNSLAVDGTGVKFPTVDAVNNGLAFKSSVLSSISELNSYVRGSNSVIVSDTIRGGVFDYIPSGLTVDNGLVFAASDGGFWVRQHTQTDNINVKWFGALGDGVTDDTSAIQAAFDTELSVYIPLGTYKVTSGLIAKGSIISDNATLKYYAYTIVSLLKKQVAGNVTGLTIDGTNVINTNYGFFNDFIYEPKSEEYSLNISNISNTSGTALGMFMYRSSGGNSFVSGDFTIKKCNVTNITSSGTNLAKGISVSLNNNSVDTNVTIDNCIVKNITTAADGDAIHILNSSYLLPTDISYKHKALINNCFVSSNVPMKRGIKVQYQNAVIENCTVIGDNTTIGYDSYVNNTVFNNCTYLEYASGSEAMNINGSENKINNLNIKMNSSSSIAIKVTNANSLFINNSSIIYNGSQVSSNLGIIKLINSTANINNTSIVCGSNSGSGLLLNGSSNAVVDNITISGVTNGIYNSYASGYLVISNSLISNVSNGFFNLGNLGFDLKITDSKVDVSNIAVYGSYSGTDTFLRLSNNYFKSANHGIISGANIVMRNNIVDAVATATGVGIAVSGSGSIVSGNRINNYTTGLQYTYTTNAEIYGNTAIGCITPFLKTGYTPFIEYENNSSARNVTASTIASFDNSKNLSSLSTTTYPSLTELSNVKGVTSPLQEQINTKANLASPTFTGTPTAPTAAAGTNTTQIATTAFVNDGLATKQNTLTNPITGTGTTNYLPKFTGANSLGNSLIFDNGTNVLIGTTSDDGTGKLQVNGSVKVANDTATASSSNVGAIRYRSTANNSYCEQVMQTGASSYSWVIIKQNTW